MLKWECEQDEGVDIYIAPAFGGHYELTVAHKLKKPIVNLLFKVRGGFWIPGRQSYSLDEVEKAKEDAAEHALSWIKELMPDDAIDFIEYRRRGRVLQAMNTLIQGLSANLNQANHDIESTEGELTIFLEESRRLLS
ncbi:MAG: hypothetical protein BWK73_09090 [Thiothrix lacustris]|uniref:Uncharacterized protein n=1 Tax=Thiothrix lacustris TaxID=525917 RepID=A0A1Y1QVI6_9GAMM|nr:MAG: hypothetical protein BWK73_09090 [Thiothrix lacustris]